MLVGSHPLRNFLARRTPMKDSEVEPYIEKGIAFLNEREGPHWPEKIDLTILRMQSCDVCVLGQLGFGYTSKLEEYDWTDADAEANGFNLPMRGVTRDISFRDWDRLTFLWIERIRQLQADLRNPPPPVEHLLEENDG